MTMTDAPLAVPYTGTLDPLTKAEANRLTERIRVTGAKLGELLNESYHRQAWAALGYESWREYATAEFSVSESYAYRLVNGVEVAAALNAAGEAVEVLPESHARVLGALKDDPDAMAEAYREASANGTPTADQIRDKVADKLADSLDEPKKKTKKKAEPHDPNDDFADAPSDVEIVPDKVDNPDTIVLFTRIGDDLIDAIETESWARVNQMVRPVLRRAADAMNKRIAIEKGQSTGQPAPAVPPAKKAASKKAAAKPAAKKPAAATAKAAPAKKTAPKNTREVQPVFKGPKK